MKTVTKTAMKTATNTAAKTAMKTAKRASGRYKPGQRKGQKDPRLRAGRAAALRTDMNKTQAQNKKLAAENAKLKADRTDLQEALRRSKNLTETLQAEVTALTNRRMELEKTVADLRGRPRNDPGRLLRYS